MIFILILAISLAVYALNPGSYVETFYYLDLQVLNFREGRGQYIRGAEVKLKVKSLELSQRFLGYDKDLSLLEADCILLGLHK